LNRIEPGAVDVAKLEAAAATSPFPAPAAETATNSYMHFPLWLVAFESGAIVSWKCVDLRGAAQWQAGA
jgi:hypothetical protein